MKATFSEYEFAVFIELEAETLEEAVLLARFGINKTKDTTSVGAYANKGGTMTAHVGIRKRKKSSSKIGS